MICGFLMLIVDLAIIYEMTNVFLYTYETLCKEAIFVDTVNIGTDKPDRQWIGVQNLASEVHTFTDESTEAK